MRVVFGIVLLVVALSGLRGNFDLVQWTVWSWLALGIAGVVLISSGVTSTR